MGCTPTMRGISIWLTRSRRSFACNCPGEQSSCRTSRLVLCVAIVVPALKARLQIQQPYRGEWCGGRKADHQQRSHVENLPTNLIDMTCCFGGKFTRV